VWQASPWVRLGSSDIIFPGAHWDSGRTVRPTPDLVSSRALDRRMQPGGAPTWERRGQVFCGITPPVHHGYLASLSIILNGSVGSSTWISRFKEDSSGWEMFISCHIHDRQPECSSRFGIDELLFVRLLLEFRAFGDSASAKATVGRVTGKMLLFSVYHRADNSLERLFNLEAKLRRLRRYRLRLSVHR
jgi:hypothetical protein